MPEIPDHLIIVAGNSVLRDFNVPDSQLELDGAWLLKERPDKSTGNKKGHSVPVDVLRRRISQYPT